MQCMLHWNGEKLSEGQDHHSSRHVEPVSRLHPKCQWMHRKTPSDILQGARGQMRGSCSGHVHHLAEATTQKQEDESYLGINTGDLSLNLESSFEAIEAMNFEQKKGVTYGGPRLQVSQSVAHENTLSPPERCCSYRYN